MYLKTKLLVLPYLTLSVYGLLAYLTDYSTFVVNHNFNVCPSATCVSATNDTWKNMDIFNKGYISLRTFYNISCNYCLLTSLCLHSVYFTFYIRTVFLFVFNVIS